MAALILDEKMTCYALLRKYSWDGNSAAGSGTSSTI